MNVMLLSLQAEKAALQQQLRTYERAFYREHNRQVSSFSDIQPMASLYRRYKAIRLEINILELEEERGQSRDWNNWRRRFG